MFSTFETIQTSSDSETSDEENYESEEMKYIKQTHFLNQTSLQEYEKNRNMLYTKDILRKRLVIDSHNYFQPDGFNTSNFLVVFDFDTAEGSSLVTTNYDIYHNVIGFRLVRTTIRTPPFNINSTNNVIKYKRSSTGDTIHTVTINPGVYNMSDLGNVFQQYQSSLFVATPTNPTNSVVTDNFAQFCTYSDSSSISNGSYSAGTDTFSPSNNTFSWTFHNVDSTNSTSTNGNKSMAYDLTFNGSDEITILWDFDNITRGTARLFGFLPKPKTSVSQKLFSDRTPDVSTHFVDLAIPQVPSIGCKRNSSGRDIIERIQLKAGHGEYLHYGIDVDESKVQEYFAPITLHRLNIQLWAVNNVLYDSNNSDASFEFEITMVKNKKLLV
jgi:hypothetical protein